jgi:hypothetical protein
MVDFDNNADIQGLTECSHDICHCTLMGPAIGVAYCSNVCRDADESGIEGETCPCGHAQCDIA